VALHVQQDSLPIRVKFFVIVMGVGIKQHFRFSYLSNLQTWGICHRHIPQLSQLFLFPPRSGV
jgi:hypothetical protein